MGESEAVVLTREQLYEAVWNEPMSTLGPRYGLSDVGLAKICRRLKVPVPGRGYWRQKQVGRKVRRPPLPNLPPTVRENGVEVRLGTGASGSDPVGPVEEQRRFESKDENRIVVPAMVEAPHPLVAQSIKSLRKAKQDHQGYLQPRSDSCLGVRVTLDSVDRAMCIYDALVKALDQRGYVTAIPQGDHAATIVRVEQEDVSVTIEERVEYVPQEGEMMGRPRQFRSRSRDHWRPTGQLVLRIEHSYLDGLRRSWGDGKRQRVEDCLNSFVVGLIAAAEVLKDRRLKREARQRESREAEARRAAEARRKAEEEARIRALDQAVSNWQRSRLYREYVSAVRQATQAEHILEDGSPLAEWLAWVEAYADRVDPLLPQPDVPTDPRPTDRFNPFWTEQRERP